MTTETWTTGEASAIDYIWTRGDNSAISHLRKIDAGAYGEVHEVLPSFFQTLIAL
jgi:hypothetical protein